ncbi:MAG: calcium/sodium antiporter [Chloroflexota bacterium]
MAILLNIGLILVGLFGLFFGGNWLVTGASRIASKLGVPALIIGLTVVAFGTSAPELMVSLQAALAGSSGIALGNVVGSNIANVGLILGMTGLVAPIAVNVTLVRREIPLMILISFACYFLLFDTEIGRGDGIVLLTGFIVFNLVMIYVTATRSDDQKTADAAAGQEMDDSQTNTGLEVGRLLVGIMVLLLGANFTVRGATFVAEAMGVPEVVIGLTLVAFGTSLPELAASLIAAFKGQSDIAVGNVIGSNIANLLLILGATSLVSPIPISEPGTFSPYARGMLSFDFPLMLGFALLMLPFALDRVLNRAEAAFFLIVYVSFIAVSFLLQ